MLSEIADGKRSMEALLSDITQVRFQLHPDGGEMELVERRELQVKHAKYIQTAWEALAGLDTNVKLKHLHSRICTATSLISLVNMWSWFDTQCSQPAKLLAALEMPHLLVGNADQVLPNDWIHPLVCKVRLQLMISTQTSMILMPEDYFPSLDAPPYCGKKRRRLGDHTIEETLAHVESAVLLWLKFPAQTRVLREASQGIAAFISKVHSIFKNYDFLYLQSIQVGIMKLRSTLLKEKTYLSNIPWQDLSTELIDHPLADDQSQEVSVLQILVEHLQGIEGCPTRPVPWISANYNLALQTGGQQGADQFSDSLSGPLYPNTPSALFCAFPRPASPTSSAYPIGCLSPT